jgi:mono/diheme cytochrome c family protein
MTVPVLPSRLRPSVVRLAFAAAFALVTSSAHAADAPLPANHSREMARGLELFKGGVRATLVEHCLSCHGGKATKGDFDLSTREGLLREGSDGPNVEPGKSAQSRLFRMVAHLDRPNMPDKAAKLPDDAIKAIGGWIDAGAPYDKPLVELKTAAKKDRSVVTDADRNFWSFQPLTRPEPPKIADGSWAKTPVDAFILAKLDAKGIKPNPPTDRRTLIRRATFDLTGLPPTPEEIDAFESDTKPGAYERLVDRLLASPRLGERWARHWLDLARYGESHGYEQDYDRPYAYYYRDFLIRALNEDMPFDRFVRLQLAGDEIEPENPQALMATGFLGAGTHATQITANQVEKERYDELDDMAATTGTAMLGLTIGCARCHDHKFDPIPTADYYRVVSTFTTTVRSEIDLDLNPEATKRAKAAYDQKLGELLVTRMRERRDVLPGMVKAWLNSKPRLKVPVVGAGQAIVSFVDGLLSVPAEARTPAQAAALSDWFASTNPRGLAIERPYLAYKKLAPKPATSKVMVTSEGVPAIRFHTQGGDFFEKTYFLKRGDLAQKGGEAPAGVLTVLNRASDGESHWKVQPPKGWRTSYRRLGLANWIADADTGAGHLLARVIVNRLWQNHFGRGIVATPSDFGVQGEKPTHPELLDYLATELIRGGWRLKPIHKLMMTSAVYQQTATDDPVRSKIDPDNTLCWRRPYRRLEAEAIRDAMLAASGLLDPTMFGPGTLDEATRRRSVYFQIKRSQLIPIMNLFDAPDSLVGIGKRPSTTVAPQALALMNNVQVRSYAKGLAARVRPLSKESPAESIRRAYRLTLGRAPEAEELVAMLDFLLAQSERYRAENKPDSFGLALEDACQSLMCLNEFVYIQ